MESRTRQLIKVAGLSLCLMAIPLSASRADTVNAGYDLLETCAPFNIPNAVFDNLTLETCPIPGSFFGAGCAAFSGTIQFRGEPLGGFNFGAGTVGVGTADTIIQREANGGPVFPTPPIPIELVALNLVSISPITVTGCTGGSQTWQVGATDAPGNALSNSTMIIRHENANGGSFSSTLFVCPRLTFTKLSGPGVAGFAIDVCTAVGAACEVEVSVGDAGNVVPEGCWSHTSLTADAAIISGATSNFFPGHCSSPAIIGTGTTPCSAAPFSGGTAPNPALSQLEDKAVQILGAAAHPAVTARTPADLDGDGNPDGSTPGDIVPDLTVWGFVALAALLLLIGLYYMGRQRTLSRTARP